MLARQAFGGISQSGHGQAGVTLRLCVLPLPCSTFSRVLVIISIVFPTLALLNCSANTQSCRDKPPLSCRYLFNSIMTPKARFLHFFFSSFSCKRKTLGRRSFYGTGRVAGLLRENFPLDPFQFTAPRRACTHTDRRDLQRGKGREGCLLLSSPARQSYWLLLGTRRRAISNPLLDLGSGPSIKARKARAHGSGLASCAHQSKRHETKRSKKDKEKEITPQSLLSLPRACASLFGLPACPSSIRATRSSP